MKESTHKIFVRKNMIKALSLILSLALIFLISCSGKSGEKETIGSVPDTDSQESSADKMEVTATDSTDDEGAKADIPAPDFTLLDQHGVEHSLSDYLGKNIMLNFWASWCVPCRSELPLLQAHFIEQGANSDDFIILGIANPADNKNSKERDLDGLIDFISDNGLTYPTLMDHNGDVFSAYMISAFPTTFLIDREGMVIGYLPGMLTDGVMDQVMDLYD